VNIASRRAAKCKVDGARISLEYPLLMDLEKKRESLSPTFYCGYVTDVIWDIIHNQNDENY